MSFVQHAAPPPGTETETDFHLVEHGSRWVLTITLTERVRRALMEADESGSPEQQFTVHVEPNLLPGEPFAVTLDVAQPDPESPAT
jgi:hypothetical protein